MDALNVVAAIGLATVVSADARYAGRDAFVSLKR